MPMQRQSEDESCSEIAALLQDQFSRLTRQLRNMELPQGITPERLSALAVIDRRGPISVTALAVKGTTLWIGTNDGLYEYRQNTMYRRGQNLLPTQHVTSIAVHESVEDVYVGLQGKGVARYRPPRTSTGALYGRPTVHGANESADSVSWENAWSV